MARPRALSRYFVPAENLRKRAERDRVPYDLWAPRASSRRPPATLSTTAPSSSGSQHGCRPAERFAFSALRAKSSSLTESPKLGLALPDRRISSVIVVVRCSDEREPVTSRTIMVISSPALRRRVQVLINNLSVEASVGEAAPRQRRGRKDPPLRRCAGDKIAKLQQLVAHGRIH